MAVEYDKNYTIYTPEVLSTTIYSNECPWKTQVSGGQETTTGVRWDNVDGGMIDVASGVEDTE